MSDKKLVQLEYDKFLKKDSAYDVSPIAVVNPDGSNISGGGGSNATVTIVGSIPAGTNQIGSVTVYGNLSASLGGNVTLNTSPNFIGLVTTVPGAVTPVSDNSGSLTVDWVSGTTVAISNMPAITISNVTLNASNAYIGLVTVANIVSVDGSGFTQPVSLGLVSLASGTEVRSLATINNFPATYPVTDNGGSLTIDWTSGATVAISNMPNITIGNVTLNTSPNQIGSVTVSNTVTVTGTIAATQSGTWDEVGINDSGNSITVDWLSGATVAVSNIPNVTIGGGNVTLNSSPNFIGLVTVANSVPVTGTFWQATQPVSLGNVTLNSSPNFIGLATVVLNSNVTLSPIQSLLSLASVYGKVDLGTTSDIRSVLSVASIYGSVGIALGSRFIGLVTTVPGAVQPVNDNSGSLTVDWLSGATVAITSMPNVTLGSNVTLNASNAFIGMATVVIGTEVVPTTIVQGIVSAASGALVQFPTNTIRWATIRAANGNATTCYIGNSSATINNGMFLDPGDFVGVAINNTNTLYLVGVGTTEVRFIGGN